MVRLVAVVGGGAKKEKHNTIRHNTTTTTTQRTKEATEEEETQPTPTPEGVLTRWKWNCPYVPTFGASAADTLDEMDGNRKDWGHFCYESSTFATRPVRSARSVLRERERRGGLRSPRTPWSLSLLCLFACCWLLFCAWHWVSGMVDSRQRSLFSLSIHWISTIPSSSDQRPRHQGREPLLVRGPWPVACGVWCVNVGGCEATCSMQHADSCRSLDIYGLQHKEGQDKFLGEFQSPIPLPRLPCPLLAPIPKRNVSV